jgi:DNA-binding MurR/RpiR family transcriptional regulator
MIVANINSNDPVATIIAEVFNCNALSLRDTFEQLDMTDIYKVSTAIHKTSRIVFFGSGGSGFMAMDEALRFSQLDLKADAYNNEYTMIMQASKLQKGEVAFGFSYSGRTRSLVGAIAEARLNGALTVGISNFRNTPLEKASDVFFCTSFPGFASINTSITSRVALLTLMDSFYALAGKRQREKAIVTRIDSVIESAIRFPARRKMTPVDTENK